jgi:hypothetical protein
MRAISSFVTTLRSPPSSIRMPIPGPVRGKRRFDSNVVAQGFWFQVRGKLNEGRGTESGMMKKDGSGLVWTTPSKRMTICRNPRNMNVTTASNQETWSYQDRSDIQIIKTYFYSYSTCNINMHRTIPTRPFLPCCCWTTDALFLPLLHPHHPYSITNQ